MDSNNDIVKPNISFTPEYLSIIGKYIKVIRRMKNNKHVLFFRPSDDPAAKSMVSKMSMDVLTHICTGTDHVSFPDIDLGIENLEELMKYIEISGYPDEDKTSITKTNVKTNFGASIPSLIIKGYDGTYHLPAGRPTLFNGDYDTLVPQTPENDPTTLVAECQFSAEEFRRLFDNIKLMGRPKVFGVFINDGKVDFYVKGPINQQYRKPLDPTKTRVLNDFTTVIEGDSEFRLFSTDIIHNAVEFGYDFELKFRYCEADNILLVKAYSTVTIDGYSDISILLGAHECAAETSEGSFEVLL
jgi:hypothetical protein